MRFLAIIALFFVAGCGKRSTDDWVRQLKDPDVVKRRQAIRELGMKTSDSARVVAALTEALKDENNYVRHDAAIALGKFAGEARSSVPALIELLADKELNVRTAAANSLQKIDPEAVKKAGSL